MDGAPEQGCASLMSTPSSPRRACSEPVDDSKSHATVDEVDVARKVGLARLRVDPAGDVVERKPDRLPWVPFDAEATEDHIGIDVIDLGGEVANIGDDAPVVGGRPTPAAADRRRRQIE